MENEIWKDVEGFENYQISSYGRVKSLNFNKESILKPGKDGRGYYVVCLSKNKIRKTLRVHRLVSKAFLPNPENKPEVNHINGSKSNNKVTNLEWVTSKENIQHAYKNGLMENSKKNAIIAHESRKIPIYSSKLDMRFESCTEAANYVQTYYFEDIKLGCLKEIIRRLLLNKITKSRYDFGWKYV